jgi:hypothetical protein
MNNTDEVKDQEKTAAQAADTTLGEEMKATKEKVAAKIKQIKEGVSEDDPHPSSSLTLRKILGGDILTAQMVRSQIWLIVIIVIFSTIYVAFRYQCQQDLIQIDKMEETLKDAKYRALSSSSSLTERCRESHVLEMLKQNKDSLLHMPDQPPYIIGEEN